MQSSELKEIEVIFFDVDDILFDQQEAHRKALYRIKDSYDLFEGIDKNKILQAFEEADEQAMNEFIDGVPIEELRWNRSKRFLKKLGVDEDFIETFHEEFYRIYPALPIEMKGAEEVVKSLASGYRLGILSNGTEEIQMKKLQALGLTEYFDEFIFSGNVGFRKPDKKIFLHALEKVKTKSDRFLYIGNSFRSDIKGADEVGMKTCWLNRDGADKADGTKPTLEIRELPELLEVL